MPLPIRASSRSFQGSLRAGRLARENVMIDEKLGEALVRLTRIDVLLLDTQSRVSDIQARVLDTQERVKKIEAKDPGTELPLP